MALDFARLNEALDLARAVSGYVGMYKINIHLYTSNGPDAVRKLARLGEGVFLDLKYHDIPNTVAGAVSAACQLPGVRLLDLHTSGGLAMMRTAAETLAGACRNRPRPLLIGVTILTSLDRRALKEVGIAGTPASAAVKLARLAKRAGLDGAVASPHEVAKIRRACGPGFRMVVPGVRPAAGGARKADDQARVATPGDAIRAGADFLVVGRPITAAADPRAAAKAIVEEISEAARGN